MIKVGKRQKLVINNFSSVGAYLFAGTDDDKDNILLPNNELEGKDLKEGDNLEIGKSKFFYFDFAKEYHQW